MKLLSNKVQYCSLLAKVYHKTKRFNEAIETLEKSRGYQSRRLKRITLEEPDAALKEKEILSEYVIVYQH